MIAASLAYFSEEAKSPLLHRFPSDESLALAVEFYSTTPYRFSYLANTIIETANFANL